MEPSLKNDKEPPSQLSSQAKVPPYLDTHLPFAEQLLEKQVYSSESIPLKPNRENQHLHFSKCEGGYPQVPRLGSLCRRPTFCLPQNGRPQTTPNSGLLGEEGFELRLQHLRLHVLAGAPGGVCVGGWVGGWVCVVFSAPDSALGRSGSMSVLRPRGTLLGCVWACFEWTPKNNTECWGPKKKKNSRSGRSKPKAERGLEVDHLWVTWGAQRWIWRCRFRLLGDDVGLFGFRMAPREPHPCPTKPERLCSIFSLPQHI